jgi:glycosyltransferase involved in cell wall biosynthesis
MPRISVLLPVCNSEAYLAQAIASVVQQTFTDFELFILDDGSEDGSLAIARQMAAKDSRVVCVTGDHRGIVHQLNLGIDMAQGEYIARMDADDVSLPNRFAAQVNFLDRHAQCCAVGTQVIRMDPDGLPIDCWRVPEHHDEIDEYHMQNRSSALIHPSVMMRKCAVAGLGGYRAAFEWAEDYDLFLRLSEVGPLANLSEVLLRYRLHAKSITFTRIEAQLGAAFRAFEDTRARRGIPGSVSPLRQDPWGQSEDELMWSWTRSAFAARNYGTARKWAFRLLSRRSTDLRRWALFGGACLGPVAVHLKRIGGLSVGPCRTTSNSEN